MKRIIFYVALLSIITGFTACESSEAGKGVINLSITDAPIDTDGIEAVYITVTGIQYHSNEKGWVTVEEFEVPKTFNLLDLTRGESEMLSSFELTAGKYTQIRFLLDAPERDKGNIANPGCYLVFKNSTTEPLFVPSGSQTGFKAVGAFTVPVNGTVDVTADFDVRKSIVKAGASGKYILKPTIRLVVDNQAGCIKGDVTNAPEAAKVVIYAYESGSFTESETTPAEVEAPRFPNAVSSDVVCELGKYHIAYLAPGTYDLIITTVSGDEAPVVAGILENIVVESKNCTVKNIDFNIFE